MTSGLPLFPLGTVLFPGLVLPLHIFEPRYRALVRDLRSRPEGQAREFGVVAIRHGWEVESVGPPNRDAGAEPPSGGSANHPGATPAAEPSIEVTGAASAEVATPRAAGGLTLYDVGCTADLRRVEEHPDGRFDIVTVGRRRFRVRSVDTTPAGYLTGDVEWLPESVGDEAVAQRLAPALLATFQRYLGLIRAETEAGEQLPDDPTVLSHLVAATAALTLDDRQRLLALPDTVSRLRAERSILSREVALLDHVRAVPVPLADLAVPSSVN